MLQLHFKTSLRKAHFWSRRGEKRHSDDVILNTGAAAVPYGLIETKMAKHHQRDHENEGKSQRVMKKEKQRRHSDRQKELQPPSTSTKGTRY